MGAAHLPEGATLSGVAPKTNLVSLKVLDGNGNTLSSVVIQAIDYIRTINIDGRDLQIHGINLSLGCPWPPAEYAAGQSPLCRELALLTGTGVIAVVSAGNAGAGGTLEGPSGDVYGQLSTITDPGNAATAITVGSVYRYRPHTYGVTFNSSKGPTLDGRPKPDLVAPRESITSASPVKSLTLIQGAFSHFTFASSLMFDPSRPGGLTGDGSRVDGPLLATFSSADRAVGWWYPAASMLAGQDSESATDLVYRWGAMGHDGYQQTPTPTEIVMQAQGKPYDFQPGTFYRLDANAVICTNQSTFSGAHSDILHPEMLWAVVSAAGLAA